MKRTHVSTYLRISHEAKRKHHIHSKGQAYISHFWFSLGYVRALASPAKAHFSSVECHLRVEFSHSLVFMPAVHQPDCIMDEREIQNNCRISVWASVYSFPQADAKARAYRCLIFFFNCISSSIVSVWLVFRQSCLPKSNHSALFFLLLLWSYHTLQRNQMSSVSSFS